MVASANGGTVRASSPPVVGSSTFTTSAPRSESSVIAHGPAPSCVKARMRTPASGSALLTLTERTTYRRATGQATGSTGSKSDLNRILDELSRRLQERHQAGPRGAGAPG